MVFLLGRMGNTRKALSMIIEDLASISLAIEFLNDQNDDELWLDVVEKIRSQSCLNILFTSVI